MMKVGLIALLAILLNACAAKPQTEPEQPKTQPPAAPAASTGTGSAYPDLGAAPELAGDVWLNTDTPLRLADLQGKVVLIDMWTFG